MAEEAKAAGGTAPVVRPLTADDLEAVVAIDTAITGRSRRGFFERRLAAALKAPKGFVYVGAWLGDTLRGFALVRLLGGEFGRDGAGMLDALGVDPAVKGAGLATAMMAAIDEVLRHKQVSELQTQAEWTNGEFLGFLAHAGFERAPRLVLKRAVDRDLDW